MCDTARCRRCVWSRRNRRRCGCATARLPTLPVPSAERVRNPTPGFRFRGCATHLRHPRRKCRLSPAAARSMRRRHVAQLSDARLSRCSRLWATPRPRNTTSRARSGATISSRNKCVGHSPIDARVACRPACRRRLASAPHRSPCMAHSHGRESHARDRPGGGPSPCRGRYSDADPRAVSPSVQRGCRDPQGALGNNRVALVRGRSANDSRGQAANYCSPPAAYRRRCCRRDANGNCGLAGRCRAAVALRLVPASPARRACRWRPFRSGACAKNP